MVFDLSILSVHFLNIPCWNTQFTSFEAITKNISITDVFSHNIVLFLCLSVI